MPEDPGEPEAIAQIVRPTGALVWIVTSMQPACAMLAEHQRRTRVMRRLRGRGPLSVVLSQQVLGGVEGEKATAHAHLTDRVDGLDARRGLWTNDELGTQGLELPTAADRTGARGQAPLKRLIDTRELVLAAHDTETVPPVACSSRQRLLAGGPSGCQAACRSNRERVRSRQMLIAAVLFLALIGLAVGDIALVRALKRRRGRG